MISFVSAFFVSIPLVTALVVYNETTVTDSGTTITTNGTKGALTSGANHTTDEMVETSCHIISEQLVATATATVSAAFSDLCRTEQMNARLVKLEERLLNELDFIKSKVEKILKHLGA